MKKIIFIALLTLSTNFSRANPIVPPQAFISEFMFTSNNQWRLEISFGLWGSTDVYMHNEFDSLCVASSSGIARIRLSFIKDSVSLLVITSDSLMGPLSFDRNGDSIQLYSYGAIYQRPLVDVVSFGNYSGAAVDSLPAGYSICRFGPSIFALDKNPTLGTSNDTSGAQGTLKGFIYNGDGTKILSGDFLIDYFALDPIILNGGGTYTATVFARKFKIGEIFQSTHSGEWEPIDTLSIDLLPDSIAEKDIHFVNVLGIKEKPVPSNSDLYITNYPNPFNPGTNFYLRIPADLQRKEGRIDIYNSIGQKVFVVPISNSSSYKWNGEDMRGKAVASGVYYYRLVFDNSVYKTGSMVLLK